MHHYFDRNGVIAMFKSLPKSPGKWLILVFALIAISVPFQKGIDNIRGKFRSIEETLYFSSSALKRLSLGYKELLADIYWMRALQYFGGGRFKEKNPEMLYHYFDILTDLDPKFVNAYRFGGTFLAEPPPLGLGDIESYNEIPTSLVALKDAGLIKQIPKEPYGREFIIVSKLKAVRSSTLLNQQLRYNLIFLTAKARRFRFLYGRFPKDLAELKGFIVNETTAEFPPNPLGEEYVYNPENGKVESK